MESGNLFQNSHNFKFSKLIPCNFVMWLFGNVMKYFMNFCCVPHFFVWIFFFGWTFCLNLCLAFLFVLRFSYYNQIMFSKHDINSMNVCLIHIMCNFQPQSLSQSSQTTKKYCARHIILLKYQILHLWNCNNYYRLIVTLTLHILIWKSSFFIFLKRKIKLLEYNFTILQQ